MIVRSAVLVTDQLSRQNSRLPLMSLVQAIEAPLEKAVEWGIDPGMPVNIDHDSCRRIGWSAPRGVYLARDMARLIGRQIFAENEEDHQLIDRLTDNFRRLTQAASIEPYAEALAERVSAVAGEVTGWWHREAAAVRMPGIAAAHYPDLFTIGTSYVDKDGLVDVSHLRARTREVEPGVFHDLERDLLLFAHPFFRRSLSRDNSLNAYVLRSFAAAADTDGVIARLRLDPDLLGHPASARPVMELEYWHGPKYDDDIASIPSGVATHKNNDHDRRMSGIDKTQIWWKPPEDRPGESHPRSVRTFEVEELVEDPSPGLAGDQYGCRYAHAEYDLTSAHISHFDGAIRAYEPYPYLERLDHLIDRAGKQAIYTKLFRLDGALSVDLWKQVLTDWFRGNRLIPEYLGAPEEDLAEVRPPIVEEVEMARPPLAAFIGLDPARGPAPDRILLATDQSIILEGRHTPIAEIGQGRVGVVTSQWALPDATLLWARDNDANLARILLPGDLASTAEWRKVAISLAVAIAEDVDTGLLARIALAISWCREAIRVTLSIEGEADLVADLLSDAADIVVPEDSPTSWAEALNAALVKRSPRLDSAVDWPDQLGQRGRLLIERVGNIEFGIRPGT
jgi:hypothetical protein